MLSEELFSSVCGPPIAANTAVSKDVGIYTHTLTPSWTPKATFKKSSAPPNCLAVSATHVFAAQDQKAHVHVYSRLRGNQEALVSFPERIRSLALAGDVLVLGTAEGRLILWETCTGRQITTPPCHVRAVSCLAVTPYHILSASEDANINVWSLSRLLELGADADHEPDRTLSDHRGAITSLAVGPSINPETSICVSASEDKTCIIWNYRTGQVLRTLLVPSIPLCVALDPCARALFVTSEDRAIYIVELYGDKPLLGSQGAELASLVMSINAPLAYADEESGPASCLTLSYDGTAAFTGHTKGKVLRCSLTNKSQPAQLANLNASVTNLVFVPPISDKKLLRAGTLVKPNQSQQYTFTTQLEGSIAGSTRFDRILNTEGFSSETLGDALLSFSAADAGRADSQLQKENEELWEIVNEQRAVQKAALARIGEGEAKA